ncbi:MAG: hypothetical protein IPL53_00465 [Ignavibacteria bacterium]|nr:hypothetical protein [Ignavibacteria bacterium]
MKKTITVLLTLFLQVNISFSQSLEENLQQVGPNYGKLYLQPLANAMGVNVNSNFFYTASVPFNSKKPAEFNIGLRLRLMNTFLTSDDQKFNYSYSDTGKVNGLPVTGTYTVVNAPTVIGNTDEAVAKFTYNGTYYPENDIELIGGIVKTTNVPLFIPEITFGTVYATDASIILLPTINIHDFGAFRMFGFTLRHNFSHYVKNSPVDYALMLGYQRMSLTESDNNDLWKSNSYFINAQLSKSFTKVITGYVALQFEQFKADVSYNYDDNGDDIPITFSIDGDNTFRGVIGGTVRTGIFAFNLDANIGQQFALSCAFNFIFM